MRPWREGVLGIRGCRLIPRGDAENNPPFCERWEDHRRKKSKPRMPTLISWLDFTQSMILRVFIQHFRMVKSYRQCKTDIFGVKVENKGIFKTTCGIGRRTGAKVGDIFPKACYPNFFPTNAKETCDSRMHRLTIDLNCVPAFSCSQCQALCKKLKCFSLPLRMSKKRGRNFQCK